MKVNLLIIDEFYGWLSWTEILRLCDRYPCQVETKGGSVQFVSKTLVFLSNQHLLEWYNNPKCQYPALARRIENLAQMRQSGNLDIEKGVFLYILIIPRLLGPLPYADTATISPTLS